VMSSNGPQAPKEEVKPNPGAGTPAADTVNAAWSKVQTGGLGDPNGIVGPGNPNRHGNISPAGSLGLPGGPGYGNGTGGAQGLRGTVASDSSGRGVGSAEGAGADVTILYKPNPSYSAEGRQHKIQGDVVLEVIFLASGQIKVIRVVSGLGFGMDDEAIHAAQRIRFTPATRDGKPVDVSARIRIEFRLVAALSYFVLSFTNPSRGSRILQSGRQTSYVPHSGSATILEPTIFFFHRL